ncbi:MAG: PrgI family protein [Nanoarchaeota archaeon]
MAYEIPQKLEYKEKIIFGLTFRQLIYLFIFVPPAAFIFFKTNFILIIKIVLSMQLIALGIGFIFLNLERHLRNWFFWLRSKKIEKPQKLAKFIPVKEISNNLIITAEKKKLAVLKITPINFSIKPEESKEAITLAFQRFLNSLDFPVQIIMSTETLDLSDYFKEVEKKIQDSDKFKELFKGYKTHLESLTKENNVVNRNFYLIIPEKSDINIQLQICQSKLAAMSLKNIRLNNAELTLLLKRFFEAREGFYPLRIENYPSHLKIIKEETFNELPKKKKEE